MSAPTHSPSPFTAKGLRSFIAFCKPWRYKIAFVAMVFIVANTLIALQPIFIGRLVDTVSQSTINSTSAWWLAIILIVLSSGHNLLWRLAEFLYRSLLFPISFRYETFLFGIVINKPYPYFVDKFTGKIGSYITSISSEFKSLLDSALFDYLGSIVSIVAVVLIMTSINWQTGAIIVVCLIGMIFVGRYTLGKDMYYQKIEADINSTKNGHIIDTIANFVSVKAFHKESAEHEAIDQQQSKTVTAGKRSFFWGIMFWGSMSIFVRDLMWPAIVVLNLWMLLDGAITIGQFTTVLATALIFTQTIWEIIWNISQFGQRISRIEEAYTYLIGVLDSAQRQQLNSAVRTVNIFKEEFSIHHLTFAYPDKPDSNVLKDVTIHIKPGEKIGIVGKSGSGKSTLTKLLLNQYDAMPGTFTFDGAVVSGDDISRFITYVPQDTTLFHRSIADNISYAATYAVTHTEIVEAATSAKADEFIVHLSDGYDTLVGERGVKLSGGQRQRIAIARAMLRNAPILILDEATSALDSESEMLVQQALEKLWHNKTVIAIAHRLSTLRHMDRIIVLDDGQIVEDGSHAELLKRDGIYAKLWKHQSGGFIEE